MSILKTKLRPGKDKKLCHLSMREMQVRHGIVLYQRSCEQTVYQRIYYYRISSMPNFTRHVKFIVLSISQTITNYVCSFSKLNLLTKHRICDILPYFLVFFYSFSLIYSFICPNFKPRSSQLRNLSIYFLYKFCSNFEKFLKKVLSGTFILVLFKIIFRSENLDCEICQMSRHISLPKRHLRSIRP